MQGEPEMPRPSDGAKKLIGDFSPKLVELTDRVLFDDVWERSELSKLKPHYRRGTDCVESS
jgi:hypothetical protein